MRIVFTLLIVAFTIPVFANDPKTELSSKAMNFELRMSKSEVFFILGKPDWVVLPTDEGDYKNISTDVVLLQYYWKNGQCNPIAVDFNYKGELVGWDEGRAHCYDSGEPYPAEYLPSEEYLCKEEREKYCERVWIVE